MPSLCLAAGGKSLVNWLNRLSLLSGHPPHAKHLELDTPQLLRVGAASDNEKIPFVALSGVSKLSETRIIICQH